MKKFFSKNIKKLQLISNRAFTLVEIIIVIGIFGVLTAIVVYQYGNFNSQVILTNMTYEVALATRQSQVYALGVRGQSNDNNFDNRYGVYFDLSEEGDPNGDSFMFFIDRGDAETGPSAADGVCNGADSGNCFACEVGSECLESFSFLRDIYIDSICLSNSNDPIVDNVCNGDDTNGVATITFERPNPDAIIYDPVGDSNYTSAAIFISNDFGDKRAVVVKSTGQISIDFLRD